MLFQTNEKLASYCYNTYPTDTVLNQVKKFTTFQFKKKSIAKMYSKHSK